MVSFLKIIRSEIFEQPSTFCSHAETLQHNTYCSQLNIYIYPHISAFYVVVCLSKARHTRSSIPVRFTCKGKPKSVCQLAAQAQQPVHANREESKFNSFYRRNRVDISMCVSNSGTSIHFLGLFWLIPCIFVLTCTIVLTSDYWYDSSKQLSVIFFYQRSYE